MNNVSYVTSACLAGLPCRYDGRSSPFPKIVDLYEKGKLLAICPEQLAGLPVPRLPCELSNGRVMRQDGLDLTAEFELGARLALNLALESGCRKAILKSRSPSCGSGLVYDGSFRRRLCPGHGLWAAKLKEAGFTIWSEENPPEDLG